MEFSTKDMETKALLSRETFVVTTYTGKYCTRYDVLEHVSQQCYFNAYVGLLNGASLSISTSLCVSDSSQEWRGGRNYKIKQVPESAVCVYRSGSHVC